MDLAAVLIEWQDSRQPVSAWQWLDPDAEYSHVLCRTVGNLIKETAEDYVVALSIGDILNDEKQTSGVMTIPRSCVQRIVPLVTSASCAARYETAPKRQATSPASMLRALFQGRGRQCA